MAGLDPKPKKPTPPRQAGDLQRKPLQVMHISRKSEEELTNEKSSSKEESKDFIEKSFEKEVLAKKITSPIRRGSQENKDFRLDENKDEFENITMGDLLRSENISNKSSKNKDLISINNDENFSKNNKNIVVDDYDFDEDEFLAALDENQPIGTTGEIAKGSVIGIESDGIYVDIGGKAPGFMPKNECGLGVITNLKERFPKGLEVEVLVTREQNADGMVTISCRALELRKSWDKVQKLEKEGKVVKVKVNGFNRGGVT